MYVGGGVCLTPREHAGGIDARRIGGGIYCYVCMGVCVECVDI